MADISDQANTPPRVTADKEGLHPLTCTTDEDIRLPKNNSIRRLLACWYPELIASMLSVASLICLVLVLKIYDRRPILNLGLPSPLTLNGIIAALATVNRAFLTAPTCAALMQEMWLFFIREGKRKPCRSRLKEIDMFFNASTGTWGSLQFMFGIRRSGYVHWPHVLDFTRTRANLSQCAHGSHRMSHHCIVFGVQYIHSATRRTRDASVL